MKPLNIYLLTRVNEIDEFLSLHKHLSGLKFKIYQEEHEFRTLMSFVYKTKKQGLQICDYDGFYYSYRIPQIGKEFDLLKITDEWCLNIELKSKMTSEAKIKEQLEKNKYYLNVLEKKLFLFTYVCLQKTCYYLDDDNELRKCNIDTIVKAIDNIGNDYRADIDNLFKVKNYLVSPLNTPESFVEKNYFLTSQQDEIKKKIEKTISERSAYSFFAINGSPGTGKTLLVYDIARQLSDNYSVLLIHCGIKSEGHSYLNEHCPNIKIVIPKEIDDAFPLKDYNAIIIDEVQRIYEKQYKRIIRDVINGNKVCLFSYDRHQILSQSEERRKIWENIESLDNIEEYSLTEKIRTNLSMAAFIRKVRNLNVRENFDTTNIQIVYSNSQYEAKELIDYYTDSGYTFINFSSSIYNYSPYDEYDSDYDTHHVIGQEFDNVLMILDNSFSYDEHGKLIACPHPNPDYLYTQLFYQGITRVREKLALIIVANKELYNTILKIL